MSDFNISNTQTIDSNPEARAALDKALASFGNNTPVVGTVSGSVNTLPTAEVLDTDELTPQLESPENKELEEDASEAAPTEEEVDLSAFDQEFSKRFGVNPEEAVETINSLLAFRDEMTLMRGWGVSPTEYDARMSQVREFYKTLPEDKQPEFNSMEGAKAIWQHLEKTIQPTRKRNSTASKTTGSSKSTPNIPKPNILRKSEILKMDKQTYAARLPEITKAYREGRVVED